jgi:hypothetical protein
MTDSTLTAAATNLDTVQSMPDTLRPSMAIDEAAFEAAWQAVSLEPVAWTQSSGPSVMADMANQQQLMLSNAFDMTGLQMQGRSSVEMLMDMTRKHIEIMNAQTSLNLSWAGVKEARKGIETVMNSK